jgi:hypothetical protein
VRTIHWDTDANEEIEVGVEWTGPQALNFTLESVPGTIRFLVAHHRVAVSVMEHLPGIHAFRLAGSLEGPGGTGVLFPYR